MNNEVLDLCDNYALGHMNAKEFIDQLVKIDRNLVAYSDRPETWTDLAERTFTNLRGSDA